MPKIKTIKNLPGTLGVLGTIHLRYNHKTIHLLKVHNVLHQEVAQEGDTITWSLYLYMAFLYFRPIKKSKLFPFRILHRELWISQNGTSKNSLPLIAFGPFRFINVTYISTRQIQLPQFWIFCNFLGYFVNRSYLIIFGIKLHKNLNAKFEIRVRFFSRN